MGFFSTATSEVVGRIVEGVIPIPVVNKLAGKVVGSAAGYVVGGVISVGEEIIDTVKEDKEKEK